MVKELFCWQKGKGGWRDTTEEPNPFPGEVSVEGKGTAVPGLPARILVTTGNLRDMTPTPHLHLPQPVGPLQGCLG